MGQGPAWPLKKWIGWATVQVALTINAVYALAISRVLRCHIIGQYIIVSAL